MRTLPDNPNIDHLRQQAKDLLVGLRDAGPTASLADAQALLAQQYGFRAWTDLKAEVDRRRGRADIIDHHLTRAVADRYGLGDPIAPMRSVARADEIGRRWTLETNRGRWAVRSVDTWRPIVDAETDVALQQAAAAAGVLLPLPVRSRDGAIVEEVGAQRWRVNEWVNAGPPLSAPASEAVSREVGRTLAVLHGLALPVDRISPYHTMRHPDARWQELAASALTARVSWAPALQNAIDLLAELGTIGEGVTTPPPVLTHNGLGPADVRRTPEGRLVILNWEHAGGQPPNWEMGLVLPMWGVGQDGEMSATAIRAIVDGYREQADALPPLDLSMFRGSITALQNYVFDETCAALRATEDEDRRHTDRSVRHVLAGLQPDPQPRARYERLLDAARQAQSA